MTKRRINKRQSARIQKMQAEFHDEDETLKQDGLVIARFGKHAEIETKNGQRLLCFLRPNLAAIVAGDRVLWQACSHDQGVIVSLYPRHSVLKRKTAQSEKLIAANISQLVIVVAITPTLSWTLLDSYLIIAENLNLQVVIVQNKIDLPCQTLSNELNERYGSLGYTLVATSLVNFQGYPQLAIALSGQTSIFVGQSGVGKSSLISGLLAPNANIPCTEISPQSQLGRHTTSSARLYHLPQGGTLIDSPGVREFGLWQMPLANLLYGFRELREEAGLCQFRNCDHQNTQGCAVIAACERDPRLQKRYESFIAIVGQFLARRPAA